MKHIFGDNYSKVITSEEDNYFDKEGIDIGDEYP
jgi:hypothetical protein